MKAESSSCAFTANKLVTWTFTPVKVTDYCKIEARVRAKAGMQLGSSVALAIALTLAMTLASDITLAPHMTQFWDSLAVA